MSRRLVAFDQSTGLKVRGSKLKLDPERNIWTTDPDELNRQRFVRPAGPDGLNRWRGPPEQVALNGRHDLIATLQSDTLKVLQMPAVKINSALPLFSHGP